MIPAGFNSCWLVDFEYRQLPGELPLPICLVAHELGSGARIELFGDDLISRGCPPYPVDASALFVAYSATAELSCHPALGWPLPAQVLDLYAEFRCLTCGLYLHLGSGMVGASHYYRLPTIDAGQKEAMRELAIRGGPYSSDEYGALLSYCAGDVRALAELYRAMFHQLDLPRALLRGRYIRALAEVEARGLPMDTAGLAVLRSGWCDLRTRLVQELDAPYGFFEATSFRTDRFEPWLRSRQIHWPRLPSGKLRLDDDTFKTMAIAHLELEPVRELRKTLATMRSFDLQAGSDGRSRVALKPWASKTARNQPGTSRFLFGLPSWMRGFLKPAPGRALSYVDCSQQEFGIAAALSGDRNMKAAYTSGDPYLAFAKQAGAVPRDATKASHAAEREQFKACVLAVQYGMAAENLSLRIGQTPAHARALLQQHRRTYRTYWSWNDRVWEHALTGRVIQSTFGWTQRLGKEINERSVRNFPMQANGAEMMRIACILAVESGIEVCAPVHDAFLIEAGIDDIKDAERRMQACMVEASRIVLDGFELRADAKRIMYPDRYLDGRGAAMWARVMALLSPPEAIDTAA